MYVTPKIHMGHAPAPWSNCATTNNAKYRLTPTSHEGEGEGEDEDEDEVEEEGEEEEELRTNEEFITSQRDESSLEC